jgi:hypothetical protein
VAGQDWGRLTRSDAQCEQSLRRQEIKNSCDAKRTKRTRLSTRNAAVGRATKWKTFVEMLTRGGDDEEGERNGRQRERQKEKIESGRRIGKQ